MTHLLFEVTVAPISAKGEEHTPTWWKKSSAHVRRLCVSSLLVYCGIVSVASRHCAHASMIALHMIITICLQSCHFH